MTCEVTYGKPRPIPELPGKLVVHREFDMEGLIDSLHLSPFELQVAAGYIRGKSYQAMASEFGKSTKSVDNALQRVKRKIEEKVGVLK